MIPFWQMVILVFLFTVSFQFFDKLFNWLFRFIGLKLIAGLIEEYINKDKRQKNKKWDDV